MTDKIYFISSNKHKFSELQSVIGNLEMVALAVPELQSLDFHKVIRAKLEAAKAHGYTPCLVDDTGYECEGLNGLPGTLSKSFKERLSLDSIYHLVASTGNTNATVKTMLGYSHNGSIEFFEGTVHGRIVSPRGINGFGWDSVFEPEGEEKTFAEMTLSEKNTISQRGQAARKLKDWLKRQE